ncbi:MAG: hypothetical protein KDA99_25110 [Planctomycetales bacterium]|nr:hypothetical protein [Planctomycetales bacterium]
MITGVVLNWTRPENVRQIVSSWESTGLVSEALVWNNNPQVVLKEMRRATIVNVNQDRGLYTRFAAMCLASNDCVLIQDDDLEIPKVALEKLYAAYRADPEILHGVFGRAPKKDGSYARTVCGDAEAPIVLTRVLLAQRMYASRFFAVAAKFQPVQCQAQPSGNGEDIIFSYAVRERTRRLHRVHAVSIRELPARDAIHRRNWQNHVFHRTRLLRACEAWLKENSDEDRSRVLHLQTPKATGAGD